MSFHKEHEEALFEEAVNLVPQFQKMHNEIGSLGMIQVIHEHIDKALEKSGIWEKATCKGACSFCCHDTILMPPLEAEYIQHILLDNEITGNTHRKELQSSGKEITFMDKACPYLADENEEGNRLCSIYEIRPIVCRTHNSTEPIKFCNKEEYPNRFINEGRIISVEAVTLALMMMKHDVDENGIPTMIPIHTLV